MKNNTHTKTTHKIYACVERAQHRDFYAMRMKRLEKNKERGIMRPCVIQQLVSICREKVWLWHKEQLSMPSKEQILPPS